jgi:hypothetical protein
MRVPASLRWFGLALLGILVAAAVSITAGRLVSQQIGLASQPISAGDALAPAAAKQATRHRRTPHRRLHRQLPNAPAPPASQAEPPASEPPAYSLPPASSEPPPSEPSPSSARDGEQGGGGADD